MSAAEAYANIVLNELPILSVSDLLLLDEIAYARGVDVVEENLEGAEASILIVPGYKSIISVSKDTKTKERRRFSIAHELGHFEMHRNKPGSQLKLCATSDLYEGSISTAASLEQEANKFASCLLLPERFIRKAYSDAEPSFDLIREKAEEFCVSLTAAAFRFIDFSKEPVCIVSSYKGRIKYFCATKAFLDCDVFVNVGESLTNATTAGCLFNNLNGKPGWANVKAENWLRSGDYREDAVLREWSINMPKYDSVLTLLWVYEELYEDSL